ncbi:MAG: hypothetical protein Q8P24_04790, partial [Desulfobacterales bacterium]|nr:hypothetical protein [Desulfobacterales bacterium]
PLERALKNKTGANRFQSMGEKARRDVTQREKEVRTYQKERQIRETRRQNVPEEKASKKPEPNRETFSRSPVRDRTNRKTDRKTSPPAMYRAPKPNLDVEPLQRDLSRSSDPSPKGESRGDASKVRQQQSRDKTRKSGDNEGQSEDRRQKSDGRQP